MANQPTTPNSAPTTKSAPLYEKLSEEEKAAVLSELKALQDDPRTTWRKKDDPLANVSDIRTTSARTLRKEPQG